MHQISKVHLKCSQYWVAAPFCTISISVVSKNPFLVHLFIRDNSLYLDSPHQSRKKEASQIFCAFGVCYKPLITDFAMIPLVRKKKRRLHFLLAVAKLKSVYIVAAGLFINNSSGRLVPVDSPNYKCQLQLADTTHLLIRVRRPFVLRHPPLSRCTKVIRQELQAAWMKYNAGRKQLDPNCDSVTCVVHPIRNASMVVQKENRMT